jgi:mycofactocin precursor
MTASPVGDNNSDATTAAQADQLDDTLIEDVSIDGMCGVY